MDLFPNAHLEEDMDNLLQDEFDHLQWMFDGYVSLVSGSKDGFRSMTGNESYYCLHYDANQYAGNENKFTDGIKKAAQVLYENITTMLKRINQYFFGDAQKNASDAVERSEDAIAALNEMDGNAPISDDSPLRNPESLIKALDGGEEFQEVKNENSDLSKAFDRIKSAADKVKGCDTVAKLRSVYAEVQSASTGGLQSVSGALRKTLTAANSAANKLRNVTIPDEDDTPEVKNGIKEENKEASDEAKNETKKARIIGGMQNKIVAALNSISGMAKKVKEKPPASAFKG